MRLSSKLPLLAILFALLFADTAPAATFIVTKLSDDNGACEPEDCSLREAVIAANADPGADLILLPAGRHLLSIPGIEEDEAQTGDLDVTAPLEIEGAHGGLTIVDAGRIDRSFSVFDPGGRVAFRHLLVTGGEETAATQNGGAFRIALADDVVIEDCEIRENSSFDAGGIDILLSRVLILRSSIVGNQATVRGGGIFMFGVGPNFRSYATLINSTVSGNVASRGGGIAMFGDSFLTVIHSTIANNDADPGSAISDEFPSINGLILDGAIIEGTCAAGFPVSHGGNIESPGDTCGFLDPRDINNVADLRLGPLDYYGGRTPSHSLLEGSPAIDWVAGECEATDQRGLSRPQDGDGDGLALCDAGAFEAGFFGSVVEVPTLDLAGQLLLTAVLFAMAIWRIRAAGA